MSNTNYIKGDLFSAPKGSILIHAVNCRGVWGGGIAKKFACLFPNSYTAYPAWCHEKGDALLGKCLIIRNDREYDIACLFTSKNFGMNVDSPFQISDSTCLALADLISHNTDNKELHACKINSGLFKVDWRLTEYIIEETGKKFTIYEY